ncbi:hypothetical protein BDK51DRAFT_31073 [Blyttiomyces helicus]|uniref:Uncharacterized protein n=1 Tax=Blyttiomyces helicus TaxID=388810 RepID=A0A4P9WQ06_9FUNG|nr:hypothetical protein BDK51DRAFT_31073 [Blyttiomyces helicus]|eukprot:RKO94233.1 hypothetical protein BDK51DRAFT_31073 [Blyttiomyces helicus]
MQVLACPTNQLPGFRLPDKIATKPGEKLDEPSILGRSVAGDLACSMVLVLGWKCGELYTSEDRPPHRLWGQEETQASALRGGNDRPAHLRHRQLISLRWQQKKWDRVFQVKLTPALTTDTRKTQPVLETQSVLETQPGFLRQHCLVEWEETRHNGERKVWVPQCGREEISWWRRASTKALHFQTIKAVLLCQCHLVSQQESRESRGPITQERETNGKLFYAFYLKKEMFETSIGLKWMISTLAFPGGPDWCSLKSWIGFGTTTWWELCTDVSTVWISCPGRDTISYSILFSRHGGFCGGAWGLGVLGMTESQASEPCSRVRELERHLLTHTPLKARCPEHTFTSERFGVANTGEGAERRSSPSLNQHTHYEPWESSLQFRPGERPGWGGRCRVAVKRLIGLIFDWCNKEGCQAPQMGERIVWCNKECWQDPQMGERLDQLAGRKSDSTPDPPCTHVAKHVPTQKKKPIQTYELVQNSIVEMERVFDACLAGGDPMGCWQQWETETETTRLSEQWGQRRDSPQERGLGGIDLSFAAEAT